MSKTSLPAPPSSSFPVASSPKKTTASSTTASRAKPLRVVALDLDFLVRVARTSLWFGALLTILAGLVTRSWFIGFSFAVGVALGVALLHSQTWFVQSLARSKTNKQAARFPVWLLLPLKYLALLVFVGLIIHFNWVNAIAFVAGASVVQFVIVAKTVGRMTTGNRASIYQSYVENHVAKGRNDR